MSGGHWSYLSYKLEERAEQLDAASKTVTDVFALLVVIEHEMDWGISCDTCYDCAKLRVIAGLECFFDNGARYNEKVHAVLTSREAHLCERCEKWEQEKRARQLASQLSQTASEPPHRPPGPSE